MKRLRPGEWLAGGSAVALFVFLFLDWFGGVSGWSSLGWAAVLFCVLAVAAGLILPLVGAANDSPVLAVIFAVCATLFGLLAVVALLIQVIAQPGPDELVDVQAGWWLGLVATLGVALGGWFSMKQESTPNARDRPIDVRPAPPVT